MRSQRWQAADHQLAVVVGIRTRKAPLLTHNGAFAWFKRAGRIDLECLVEPIVAEATTARESRTVRINPVVAWVRSLDDSLREHRACGERKKR